MNNDDKGSRKEEGEEIEVKNETTLPTPRTVVVARSGRSGDGPRFKDQIHSMIGNNNSSSNNDEVLSEISTSYASATTATASNIKPLLIVPRQRQQPSRAAIGQQQAAVPNRHNGDDRRDRQHHAQNAYMVPEAVAVNEEVTIPLADAVPDPKHAESEPQQTGCCGGVRLVILLTTLVMIGCITAGILVWQSQKTAPTFAAFTTQDELYTAVDLYFTTGNNGDEQKENITAVYGDLRRWDVSRVTNFSHVFSRLRNEDVATATITDPSSIDLSEWDVSSGLDFSFQFFGTQWLTSNTNLSAWDTRRATTMKSMFHQATSFNGDVTTWNTAQVTTMMRMFSDVRGFNQDIRHWDVFNVKSFKWMFFDNVVFDQDLSDWDTRNGEDFSYMFRGATSFNSDLSRWVTRRANRFEEMFRDASSFNQDISQWIFAKNTSSAAFNMTLMFSGASSFDRSLCEWRTAVPVEALVVDMFDNASRCASMQDPVGVMGQWEGPFCQPCSSS